MEKIDLSIIILNYNTREFLKECLDSIGKSRIGGCRFEIIVVDNASQDGSPEMVKKKFPAVKLIVSKNNIGFSAGNNLAVPGSSGKYLLFLNPDTKIFPETLKVMIDYMETNGKVGIATCKVELANGQLDYPCHRGFPTPWNSLTYFSGLAKIFPKSKLFSGYTLSHLPLNQAHEIDSCSGSFFFVRREVGESLDWWDEDYFWYGDDIDFCYRVKKMGWMVMFVPKTRITHYRGASSGIIKHSQKIATASKETKLKSARASIEAMKVFYKKHYSNKYPKIIFRIVLQGISFLERLRLLKIYLNG